MQARLKKIALKRTSGTPQRSAAFHRDEMSARAEVAKDRDVKDRNRRGGSDEDGFHPRNARLAPTRDN